MYPLTLRQANIETGSTIEATFVNKSNYKDDGFSEFKEIQKRILDTLHKEPSPPVLSSYGVTQTTAILRWEELNLHPVELLKIRIFKDSDEVMNQVNPAISQVRITGLNMGYTYNFFIIVYTSAGKYRSNRVSVTTLTMEDLRGLNICFGIIEEAELEELKSILLKHSASYSEDVSLATTHFVTTKPSGSRYAEAKDLDIPIVTPSFIKACDIKKRVQPASSFALQSSKAPQSSKALQSSS